jgi:HEPN domain-containing protein
MMIMNRDEKYAYWLDSAEYDLKTADAMLKSKRWVYVVFMCQQAIEKLLKGLYILYINDEVPRMHTLSRIIDKYSDLLPETVSKDQYDLFDRLTAFYISGRYPEYKDKISQSVSSDEAKELFEKSKEVFLWLLTMRT